MKINRINYLNFLVSEISVSFIELGIQMEENILNDYEVSNKYLTQFADNYDFKLEEVGQSIYLEKLTRKGDEDFKHLVYDFDNISTTKFLNIVKNKLEKLNMAKYVSYVETYDHDLISVDLALVKLVTDFLFSLVSNLQLKVSFKNITYTTNLVLLYISVSELDKNRLSNYEINLAEYLISSYYINHNIKQYDSNSLTECNIELCDIDLVVKQYEKGNLSGKLNDIITSQLRFNKKIVDYSSLADKVNSFIFQKVTSLKTSSVSLAYDIVTKDLGCKRNPLVEEMIRRYYPKLYKEFNSSLTINSGIVIKKIYSSLAMRYINISYAEIFNTVNLALLIDLVHDFNRSILDEDVVILFKYDLPLTKEYLKRVSEESNLVQVDVSKLSIEEFYDLYDEYLINGNNLPIIDYLRFTDLSIYNK